MILALGFAATRLSAAETNVEIQGFSSGSIIWTTDLTDANFTIEWASSAEGPWSNDWNSLYHQSITDATMSVNVPMFFRVALESLDSEWVTVAEPNNPVDDTGYGKVWHSYEISKYEINNAQYAEFLNAVDPGGTNPLSLYSANMASHPAGGIVWDNRMPVGEQYIVKDDMEDKPVVFVSYWDCLRFINWLHNGKGSGGTGDGAYLLTSVNPANGSVSLKPGANYFMPSEDEWYKAAYYDPMLDDYWQYPTKSDSAPTVARVDSIGNITNDTDSIANYNSGAVWNGQTGNVTTVGSGGPGSESPYGVADLGGNAYEWNEGIISSDYRCVRGGCWYSAAAILSSTTRQAFSPDQEFSGVGFRVCRPAP
ncbi:MAG: formylglycine-generating enzyme family protein [Planctomycetota bacterium]